MGRVFWCRSTSFLNCSWPTCENPERRRDGPVFSACFAGLFLSRLPGSEQKDAFSSLRGRQSDLCCWPNSQPAPDSAISGWVDWKKLWNQRPNGSLVFCGDLHSTFWGLVTREIHLVGLKLWFEFTFSHRVALLWNVVHSFIIYVYYSYPGYFSNRFVVTKNYRYAITVKPFKWS